MADRRAALTTDPVTWAREVSADEVDLVLLDAFFAALEAELGQSAP
ncbi:MAG: hypothetical protein QM621_04890 [Aeromicrobium sp.]